MKLQIIILFTIAFLVACKRDYKENLDINDLKTLPKNFYGYRAGSVYLNDIGSNNFMLWYRIEDNGKLGKLFRIDNFKNRSDSLSALTENKIDTLKERKNMELFLDLSRKYGFGHISMDTVYKCYLSRLEDLPEQYVMPFNDSIRRKYLKDKNFKFENGWFVHK
ncbi:MAG: hypothetical protein V4548_13520 [Bacteroidota bacterium]